jgi:putative membrane protein
MAKTLARHVQTERVPPARADRAAGRIDPYAISTTHHSMKPTLPVVIVSLAAASLIVPSAWAQADKDKDTERRTPGLQADEKPISESDFVTKAAARGATELKFAELGASKAQGPKVKELAQMMVREHTSANQEIKTIAGKLDIKLDDTPDAKAQEKYKELNAKTGREFDAAFLAISLMCHQNNIEFYEAGKALAKNADVTAHINKTLPLLKSHSEKVENLKAAREKEGDTAPRPGPATDPASPEKK